MAGTNIYNSQAFIWYVRHNQMCERAYLLKVLQKQLFCNAANARTAVQCYSTLACCSRLELLTIALHSKMEGSPCF